VIVEDEGRGANVVSLDLRRSHERAKQERVRVFNGGAPEQFVTAAVLADVLGFTRDWVYEHKHELGGIPSGLGPKPRWRFPLNAALSRMAAWTDQGGQSKRKPAPLSANLGGGLEPVTGRLSICCP
jgi:hypothetical protein